MASRLCDKGFELLDTQEYEAAAKFFKKAQSLDSSGSYQHFANMAEMGASGSLPSF